MIETIKLFDTVEVHPNEDRAETIRRVAEYFEQRPSLTMPKRTSYGLVIYGPDREFRLIYRGKRKLWLYRIEYWRQYNSRTILRSTEPQDGQGEENQHDQDRRNTAESA